MPRFAILEHDYPETHWDFFLESGEVLRSWKLYSRPEPNIAIRAESAPDHRLPYLTYEGPVSGDRGSVTQFAIGQFDWMIVRSDLVIIEARGASVDGQIELARHGSDWTFRLTPFGPTSAATNMATSTDQPR